MPDPTNPFLPIPQIPFPAVARKTKEPAYTEYPVEFDNQGNYFEVIPDPSIDDSQNSQIVEPDSKKMYMPGYWDNIDDEGSPEKIKSLATINPFMDKVANLANDIPLPGTYKSKAPAFAGEYEKAKQLAKDEYLSGQQTVAPDVKIFGLDGYGPEIDYTPFISPEERLIAMAPEGPVREPETMATLNTKMPNVMMNPFRLQGMKINTEINPLTQDDVKDLDIAEKYYAGKAGLDAVALFNNMIQPEPPSLQVKLPHYERMKLNPEPYDTMRSEMRDQGTQAYRLQRENVSQASDLMKGLAAVTSGTQQGLMQVGMQQAGAEQQNQQVNQQIASQETDQQTQMLNQEAAMNYQTQQQAQQFKDTMISNQLGRIGETAGAYAAYVTNKELAKKMTDLSKYQADTGNAIQLQMLKYQIGQNEMNSDIYKEAEAADLKKYMEETKKKLYEEERFKQLRDVYGENYDFTLINEREKSFKELEMNLERMNKSYNGFNNPPVLPEKTADMTADQWKMVQDAHEKKAYQFEQDKKQYLAAKEKYEQQKPIIDLEKRFIEDLKTTYNVSGKRQDFRSSWMRDRGLEDISQIYQNIESLMNPNRQNG